MCIFFWLMWLCPFKGWGWLSLQSLFETIFAFDLLFSGVFLLTYCSVVCIFFHWQTISLLTGLRMEHFHVRTRHSSEHRLIDNSIKNQCNNLHESFFYTIYKVNIVSAGSNQNIFLQDFNGKTQMHIKLRSKSCDTSKWVPMRSHLVPPNFSGCDHEAVIYLVSWVMIVNSEDSIAYTTIKWPHYLSWNDGCEGELSGKSR